MLNFDYFIAGSWDHQFLLECVFRTLQVFTLYNFKVRVFVCDGASANLALIKVTRPSFFGGIPSYFEAFW